MPVKIATGSVSVGIAQIQFTEGQRITLEDINWQKFESILEAFGEHCHLRIAYYKGDLEIRMPLPAHERAKVLVSNLVVILLDELGLEWESLGSSTFKKQEMKAAIEPDDCFYIKNYREMIGKERLDLTADPVPDLAIEVDLTSKTQVSAYEALGIEEIWRMKNGKLEINLLQDGKYITSVTSKNFPTIAVIEGISLFLERSTDMPISALRREFRQWLREKLANI
jgi:Uma2 family endonuclease